MLLKLFVLQLRGIQSVFVDTNVVLCFLFPRSIEYNLVVLLERGATYDIRMVFFIKNTISLEI